MPRGTAFLHEARTDMTSRTRKIGSAALLFTFAAAAWFFLAPPVLGGSTTYTITTGNSMEPLLHEGDLAVVKERSTYAIGDVVAYDSADLGRTVLHRIIGRDGDSFAFKGDNNASERTWRSVGPSANSITK